MEITDSVIDRFEQKISPDPNSGCWLWTAFVNNHGYGVMSVNGKCQRAHVISWEIYKAMPRGDKYVCHKCDTKSCVNPGHLYLGTPSQNIRDFVSTGRHYQTKKTNCKRGHGFNGKNLIINSFGMRQCRECVYASHKKWRKKQVVGIYNGWKTHCLNGHPYSGTNLIINRDGRRACLECRKTSSAKYRNKKKGA